MDEQSVSAMMPKRTWGVSGESSAYSPTAHPLGTPPRTLAIREPVVVLRNLRRVTFINAASELEEIGDHQVRKVECLARCRIFQECPRKDMSISTPDLDEVIQGIH